MDKPLSGQRIKVCGEVHDNREEPRQTEPEGRHAPTPSLPQELAQYELAMLRAAGV